MPKRDYKSYNVLGEELAQEGNYEEHQNVEAQDLDAVSFNKSKSQMEDDLQAHVIEANPTGIETLNIEEQQGGCIGESVLQPKKKINLGKKLRKNKETDLDKSVDLTNNIDLNKNEEIDKYTDIHNQEDKNKYENRKIDSQEDKNKYINKNPDNDEDKGKYANKKVDKNNEEIDMTFSAYKTHYQTKKRSKLVKWSVRLAKLILVIMLLPLIAIISSVALGFFGGFLAAIITAIGTGVFILGAICFMSTQVSASLIALGVAVSVTCISLGSILFILFWMLLKWIGGLFKKYKKSSSQSIRKEKK